MDWSPAEIAAVAAICSLVSTSLAPLSRVSVTFSTAFSMPRLRPSGLAPAATLRRPSRTNAWASTVAVVVPSPATSSVFLATSLTSSAPIFSYGSSSSISLAMDTPSLVIVGHHFFSGRRCGPWGPMSPLPHRRGRSSSLEAATGLRRTQLSWPLRSDSSGSGMKRGHRVTATPLLTLAGRSARDGRLKLSSLPLAATTGLASPSRPSTHRSRVPTLFLALAYAECKKPRTGSCPSFDRVLGPPIRVSMFGP